MTNRYTLAELLSIEDAAAELGISPARVRLLVRERALGRRIGRDHILTPDDLASLRERGPNHRPKA